MSQCQRGTVAKSILAQVREKDRKLVGIFLKIDFIFIAVLDPQQSQVKGQRFPISPHPTPPCTASPITNTPHHHHQRVTFVIIDDPALTPNYHPKSTVHLMVHSWSCTFYRFEEMCSDTYLPLWFIQNSFTALKILCALPIYPSIPANP